MSAVSKNRRKRIAKKYLKKINKVTEMMEDLKRLKKEVKKKMATQHPRKRKRSVSTSSSTGSLSSFLSDSSACSSSSGTSHAGEDVQDRTPPLSLSKFSFSEKDNDAKVSRRNVSNKSRSRTPEICRKVPDRVEPIVKKRKSATLTSPIPKKRTPLMERNSAVKGDFNEKTSFNKITKTKKAKVAESCVTEKEEETSDAENKSSGKKNKSLRNKMLNTSIDKDERSIQGKAMVSVQKSHSFGCQNEAWRENKNQKTEDIDHVLDNKTKKFLLRKAEESLEEKRLDAPMSDVAKEVDIHNSVKSTGYNDKKHGRFAGKTDMSATENTASLKTTKKQSIEAAGEPTKKLIIDELLVDKTEVEVPQEFQDLQAEKNDYKMNVELLRQLFGFPKNIVQVLSKTRDAIKIAEEFLDAMGMNEEILGSQTSTVTVDSNKNLQFFDKSLQTNGREEDEEPMTEENENETKAPTTLHESKTFDSTMDLGESLAAEWSSIMIDSLDKTVEAELLDKHLPPENFPHLLVPTVNPQLRSVMNEIACTSDQVKVSIQTLVGSAISAVGKALTMLLSDSVEGQQGKTKKLIDLLGDAGKILANLYHIHFYSRRSEMIPKIGEFLDSKSEGNLIDRFVFGEKFAKTWRNKKPSNDNHINKNKKINAKMMKNEKSTLVNVATSPMPKKAQPKSDKPTILSVQTFPKVSQKVGYVKLQTTTASDIPSAKAKSRTTIAHSTPRYSSKEASMIQVRLPHKTCKVSDADTIAVSETKNASQNPPKHDLLMKNQGTDLTALHSKKHSATTENFKNLVEMKIQKFLYTKNSNKIWHRIESSDEENLHTTDESDPETVGKEGENYSEDEDVDEENEVHSASTNNQEYDSKDDEENNAAKCETTDSEESEESIRKEKTENNSKENRELSSKDDEGNNSKENEENISKEDEEDNSSEDEGEENNPNENGKNDSKQRDHEADSRQGEESDSREVKDMSVEEAIDTKEEQKRETDKDHTVLKQKHPDVATDSSKLKNANSSLESTRSKKNVSALSSRGEQGSNSQDDRDSGEEQQDDEKIHSIEKTESWISCNSSLNETRESQILQKSEKIILEPTSVSHGQVNFSQSWKSTGPPHEVLAKVMQARLRMGKKLWRIHSLASSQETSNVPALDKPVKNVPEDASSESQELEKP